MADTKPGDGDASKLKAYWLVGAGAAKIRWNTPGDFTRCVRLLDKHMPGRAEGYCANLHHDATGTWPGEVKGKNPNGPG